MVPVPGPGSPPRETAVRRPEAGEVAPFYRGYLETVPEGDVLALLERGPGELRAALSGLDESRGAHRYAPGKWSIKEVLGHVNDAERVFSYRALRMARGDTTPLASFDQDAYVARSLADRRRLADLLDEFAHLRAASVLLFRGFEPAAWERKGTASDCSFVVCAFPFILAGHELHHRQVLVDRYL
jgi:DinB family protein